MSEKRIITATKIKYDKDGAKVDLPKSIQIEIPEDLVDYDEIEEYISDKISDETGFCHNGFSTKPSIEDFLKNEKISISFKVDVTFSRGIQNREDIEEIARNIARAIYNEANSGGIASEDSEAYTKKIEVTPFGMEDFIATRNIYLD
jgi:hypothetical protein